MRRSLLRLFWNQTFKERKGFKSRSWRNFTTTTRKFPKTMNSSGATLSHLSLSVSEDEIFSSITSFARWDFPLFMSHFSCHLASTTSLLHIQLTDEHVNPVQREDVWDVKLNLGNGLLWKKEKVNERRPRTDPKIMHVCCSSN